MQDYVINIQTQKPVIDGTRNERKRKNKKFNTKIQIKEVTPEKVSSFKNMNSIANFRLILKT